MALEDRESDALQRLAELAGKSPPLVGAAVEPASEIAGPDLVGLVERVLRRLREVVALLLVDLVVAEEIGAGGVNAFGLAVHVWLARMIAPMMGRGKRRRCRSR
jgi:hypothetical protein